MNLLGQLDPDVNSQLTSTVHEGDIVKTLQLNTVPNLLGKTLCKNYNRSLLPLPGMELKIAIAFCLILCAVGAITQEAPPSKDLSKPRCLAVLKKIKKVKQSLEYSLKLRR